MTLFIVLTVLFFAALSLAPLLIHSDPDAKSCVLWRE